MCLHAIFCTAERVGRGNTRREAGQGRWNRGDGWGHPQSTVHMGAPRRGYSIKALVGTGWANSHPGFINGLREMLLLVSTCRGLISGRKGCLSSEQVFPG